MAPGLRARRPVSALAAGLPPAGAKRPRALILGSLPSVASLRAQQYYAHPRNHFWPIMGALLGFDPARPYARRVAALAAAGIAVWDVLAAAERPGSADAAIAPASMQANDLAQLAGDRPLIAVALNGGTAARVFERMCRPPLDAAGLLAAAQILPMPSTSAANATYSLQRKIASWQRLAEALEAGG